MDDQRLWKHFLAPRSAVGLGMFRIAYSLTLFCEVSQLCDVRHLVFDDLPFVRESPIYTAPVFAAWLIVIASLAVGLCTRWMAVANYAMTLATFSIFREWEYHVDYVYTGVNAFLLFVPVSRAVSVDAWLYRRRVENPGEDRIPAVVPRVHYDALILVGIALVYFDSVFYKLASPMWLAGLGLWRPASLPHNTFWNVGWLLDQRLLMLTLSYVTLAFECAFLPLMWFDRLRPFLFIIGVGLHLGIVVMFPIPWFGFAVFALYLLLVPDRWWGVLLRFRPVPCSPENSSRAMFSSRDLSLARIVFTLAIVVSVWQLTMTSTSNFARQLSSRWGGESVRRALEQVAIRIYRPGRILFGVTRHPVFMDFHFDHYQSFFTLAALESDGSRTWLPMAAPTGQGRLEWSGRLWVNWTWRVVNPVPQSEMLHHGFERVTAWWLGRRGRPLTDATFAVMRRPCDPCEGWELGYYQRQLSHDWKQVGIVRWVDGEFQMELTQDALTETEVKDSPRGGNERGGF